MVEMYPADMTPKDKGEIGLDDDSGLRNTTF
jgi:hypothetical protein